MNKPERERGGGAVYGPPEQVAGPSRCCRKAAKQIMACLDYLRDPITVEPPHLGQLWAGSAGISCSRCHPAGLSCLSPAQDQWRKHWSGLCAQDIPYCGNHIGKFMWFWQYLHENTVLTPKANEPEPLLNLSGNISSWKLKNITNTHTDLKLTGEKCKLTAKTPKHDYKKLQIELLEFMTKKES